ncbi:Xaa-Pro peptidase family protein [Marispirochaeta sp.]|jgi:Xaa-Pro dipeptidase|uniref:Xaa-Pro peptidase family protein n=1 Tax=Marispirochaeta sp. TaxID=2038653 RepID=UPI0029C8E186|nr:Xaa-Pro peptidase family protein [Marispirochaeta sp.]
MANYRLSTLQNWMEQEGIELVVLEDTEGRRNASLRYVCGHPSDALFFFHSSGASLLVAWDLPLAELYGTADALVAYSEFQRSPVQAIVGVARRFGLARNARIELPSGMPLPLVESIRAEAPEFSFLCRYGGAETQLKELRSIKDAAELDIYREAAGITNSVINDLVQGFRDKRFSTELDAALFIEAEVRRAGAEGTGFETIVANPERSFGIHAFPSFSGAGLGLDGPTIIDFGVKLKGYTTDVTLTIIRGSLNPEQERMAALVEEAYAAAEAALAPGVPSTSVARRVDEVFEREGFSMPHSLGHAIGLEAHEQPVLRDRKELETTIRPGMVLAIEPGLYAPEPGGFRKENDYLVTERGIEKLTQSGFFRI